MNIRLINNIITKKRLFLVMSFVCGFCVMVVELTATRAVTPFVGSTIYTWTSIIGVVLLGISLGNYIGGYLIDKYDSIKTLFIFLLLSSLSILSIPFLLRFISIFFLRDISILTLILLVSSFLFLVPSFFLGCLYPSILKLYSRCFSESGNLGKRSGLISSMWSLGSIIGTFLTGFYFIGVFGTKRSFIIISAILFSFSLLLIPLVLKNFTFKKKILILILLVILLLGVLRLENESNQDENIIFSKESNYYKITVVDRFVLGENVRILFLDFDSHSIEARDGEDMDIYTSIYPITSIFNKNIDNIFVIGGGSYDIAKNLNDFYKDSKIIVSEIDPEVTKVAEEFFDLNKYSIKTVIGDSRFVLNDSEEKYDLIYGDAYSSFISVPWHLVTNEFNEIVKKKLRDKGIYIINFMSSLEGENSEFFESMLSTFKQTFNNMYIFAYGKDRDTPQNIVFVGVNSNEKMTINEFKDKVKMIKNGKDLQNKIIEIDSLKATHEAAILVDDYAPVENLTRTVVNNYFKFYLNFFYTVFFPSK